ncbi:hypothetical protein REPUB_Repub15cG0107200 [Reevesia pubescens]
MADDPMNSDSYVSSKRRITIDTHQQQEETLLRLQLSSSLSETPQDHQEETSMEDGSPKKKAKCLSLLYEGNQELGFPSFTEKNVSLSGSFEKIVNEETKGGSFGVQEVDSHVNVIEVDVGPVFEADDKKGHLGTCLESEEKRVIKGKALESETVLEAEKERLLGELEVGKIFGAKTCNGNISGFARNSSKIDDGNDIGGIKGLNLPVRGSLKIEVIDDTALIGSFPFSKPVNGIAKDEMKKGKQEVDGKKAKRSRRKGKNAKKVLGEAVQHMEPAKIVELQNGWKESKNQSKITYSIKELESLRFAKVVEQRNFWRDVYNSLGTDVIGEYEDLGSWKHQKNINLSTDTRHRFGRKAESPVIWSEDFSESVDNETENIYPLDLNCTHDVGVEDAFIDVEEECIEDEDSDEDYTSILRPAFIVKGEPDFDSGPPEDGLEYLRRVRWEAAQIPKVNIAKSDRIKLSKEQSVYMPQIPEIAKCPEHLLPLKQWEEAFLADFSELRQALSYLEDPSAEVSCKLPKFTVQEEDLCQLPENVVVEKFNNLAPSEVHSDQTSLSNAADGVISPSHQNPCAKTSVIDTCGGYPTLSAIRKMDSVARVSMLRKRISSVENMTSLSRSNCVWLFALCAAVDTPLDADTCASLRSLLRKCANLRAGKSEVDDEVVMLNILATISGKYFGQLES